MGTEPVSRSERQGAAAVIALAFAAAMLVLPLRAVRIGPNPGFFAVWSAIAFGAILISTTLASWRALIYGDRRALALAAAFAFSLPILATNIATLPGLVALPAARSSTESAWLLIFFSYALSAGFIAYASTGIVPARYVARTIVAAFGLGLLTTAAAFVPALPAFAPARVAQGAPAWFVATNCVPLAVLAAAGVLMARRYRTWTSLDAWVAAFISLQFVQLALTISSQRFSGAWYVGRIELVAAVVALAASQAIDFGRLLARAENVKRYAALAQHSPDVMYMLAPDGTCTYVNERWTDVTGQPPEAALGDGWKTRVHPDDLPPGDGRTTAPAVEERRVRLRTHGGLYRWHLARRTPLADDTGAVSAYLGAASDIHEQVVAFERERAIAARLQEALFSPAIGTIAGFTFDAVYHPASELHQVGGDWYDVLPLRDGRIAVLIGDVAGHGVDAAIGMVHVREVLRAAAMLDGALPEDVLAAANRFLCARSGIFATALVALFDPATHRVRIAAGGHPLPIHAGARGVAPAGREGMMLGVESGAHWTSTDTQYADGDRFAFYTDGLVESNGWLEDREPDLRSALARGGDAATIVRDLTGPRRRDDVALLIVSIDAGASSADVGWTFFSGEAASAHAARPSLLSYLDARGATSELRTSAENVFGELVGNVVRHAPGWIAVSLTWEAEGAVLRVADGGSGFAWSPALPADPFAESGRGQFIVALHSRHVDVRARPSGGTEVVVGLNGAAPGAGRRVAQAASAS